MAEGGEEIPLLDITKGEDDVDEEGEKTVSIVHQQSTSIDQGYLGYSEYMAERRRNFIWK